MSRRYRQKGYMDDAGDPRRPRPEQPAAERKEGPRGRGLGAPTETRFRCARCGAEAEFVQGVAPEAVCGKCGDDLHSCTNCRQLDPSARFECRLPIPERIRAKAKRNECDQFEPKLVSAHAPDAETPSGAKAAFDALFDF